MIAGLCTALAVWFLVLGPSSRLRSLLEADAPQLKPLRRLELAWVAAASVPFGLMLLLGFPAGALLGLGAAPVAYRVVKTRVAADERRRIESIRRQLPDALDLVAAALEAGKSPHAAFSAVASALLPPLATDMKTYASRLSMSGDPESVWTLMCEDPALAALGRAFLRADRSGAPVAAIVRGTADEQRRERRAERRRQAANVAVHTAAPLGLCFLPAFFLVSIVPTLGAALTSMAF